MPSHDYSDKPKFYDQHTLFVRSGVAHPYQLSKSLKSVISQLSRYLKERVRRDYKINLLQDPKDGHYFGFGYIWVSDPRVYNVLLGKNPDGSQRVKSHKDPNWEPPSQSLEDAIEEIPLNMYEEPTLHMDSWADFVDKVDEIKQQYNPPYIHEELPAIVSVPPIEYDEQQKKILEETRETEDPIPDIEYFLFGPAYVTEVESNFTHYILCARKIPQWINEAYLKQIFAPYASDNQTYHLRKVRGKKFKDTYPFITINSTFNGRNVFITFDPCTRDAQFALLLNKKYRAVNPKTKEETQLCFSYAFKNKSPEK